jgi:hypothetical protein
MRIKLGLELMIISSSAVAVELIKRCEPKQRHWELHWQQQIAYSKRKARSLHWVARLW